jgi:hypothetical protein
LVLIFIFSFSGFNAMSFIHSDILFELYLQIVSFKLVSISQQDIILKAQGLLQLASSSLKQKVTEVTLTVSLARVNIFTSFQLKLISVLNILASLNISTGPAGSSLTAEETMTFMQVVVNFTSVLQSQG